MKFKVILNKFINCLYVKFPWLSIFFLNHLILILFSFLSPIAVSAIYTNVVENPEENNIGPEIITFVIWFSFATLVNYLFISVLAKDNIKTKETAEIYKYWLSLSYFFALTLMTFLSIDKLIKKENYSIIVFLITISFGSLSSTASFVFRDHKKHKSPNEEKSFYEKNTQVKEFKEGKYIKSYTEYLFYKNDDNEGQTCFLSQENNVEKKETSKIINKNK